MTFQFDLALLSKYRTQLMGVAMLWVMFRHSEFNDSESDFIIRLIHRSGYGGVDVFFLLSGLGLYFAYNKEKNIKVFFFRRLVRILPYYIPVVVLYTLLFQYPIGEIELKGVFLRIFLLDYWVERDALGWYIPITIFFYFLTPLIIFILRKSWTRNCILLILIIFFIGFSFDYWRQWWWVKDNCIRLASYVFGIYVGFAIAHKKKINAIWLFVFFLIGTLLYASHYCYAFEVGWINAYFGVLPFFFLALPICSGLSFLFSLFKNYKFPFLYFIGTYTLCIYIFHERIKLVMAHYDLPNVAVTSFILSIILAVIWQKLISMLLEKTKITTLFYK